MRMERLGADCADMSLASKVAACALAAAMAASLVGCSGSGSSTSEADGGKNAESGTSSESYLMSLDLDFTDRDMDASYDESSATKVVLSDAGVSVDGAGATVDGSTVMFSQDGTYLVSGSLSNGSLAVEAEDDDKIQIVLDGASIHNETGPALLIDNANKVFVTLAEGSENTLSDGGEYELSGDDDNRDATVFSREDVTFNGAGSLSVTGSYNHAICSKDDLVITGGTFDVTSKQDAFTGKDCLKIADGNFTVNAGDDAFHSEAFLYIRDAEIDVQSCYEGFEGEQVIVDGGNHTIVSSDDAINAALSDSSEGASAEGDAGDGSADGAAGAADPGAAIAEDGDVDDIDPQMMVPPNAGERPDDGDASEMPEMPEMPEGGLAGKSPDAAAPEGDLNGNPPELPEGAEAPEGGFGNAGAPDSDSDADVERGQGAGGFGDADANAMAQSSSECIIQINGGSLLLTAGNDAIDSNGIVEINGGIVLASGPDNGFDGSLDYDMTATINGGTVLLTGSVGNTNGLSSSAQSVAYGSASGSKGQEVSLLTVDGEVLATFTAGFDFSTVLASAPQLSDGEQFVVKVGETNVELTMGDISGGLAGGMGGISGGAGDNGAGGTGDADGLGGGMGDKGRELRAGSGSSQQSA